MPVAAGVVETDHLQLRVLAVVPNRCTIGGPPAKLFEEPGDIVTGRALTEDPGLHGRDRSSQQQHTKDGFQ